jgi:hypothetical protein
MPKSCSRCGLAAEFSLCLHLSTVGRTPRQQKCMPGVLLCIPCIQAVAESLEVVVPSGLSHSLSGTYTAMATHSAQQPNGDSNYLSDTERVAQSISDEGGQTHG